MKCWATTLAEKETNKWVRIWGGIILGVATVCGVVFVIPITWKGFWSPLTEMDVPSAFIAYLTIMAQLAFFLLRRFRTLGQTLSRFGVLFLGWILATLALWDLIVVDLPPILDRPEFIVTIVGFVTTCVNLIIEGKPQPAQAQTVAWAWNDFPALVPAVV